MSEKTKESATESEDDPRRTGGTPVDKTAGGKMSSKEGGQKDFG